MCPYVTCRHSRPCSSAHYTRPTNSPSTSNKVGSTKDEGNKLKFQSAHHLVPHSDSTFFVSVYGLNIVRVAYVMKQLLGSVA